MPLFTSRLGLTLPLTTENYDIAVHNGNMSILDGAPANAVVCTSSTRPSTPDDGDLIFESDSSNILARHSSTWKAGNGKFFICTSSTRPASGLTYGGFPIYETDTGNRQVRNAANSAWIPLSPFRVADAAERVALGGLPDGFLVFQDDTNEYWQEFGGGSWGKMFGHSFTNRQSTGFGTTTSTSYTATLTGGTVAGVAFTAPLGGRVFIWNTTYQWTSNSNGTFGGFEVRTGAVVGSGTVVLAASDANSTIVNGTDAVTCEKIYLLTGLTSGADYNVRQVVKVGAGSTTGTFNYHSITVSAT